MNYLSCFFAIIFLCYTQALFSLEAYLQEPLGSFERSAYVPLEDRALDILNTTESVEKIASDNINCWPKKEYHALLNAIMDPKNNKLKVGMDDHLFICKRDNTFYRIPIKEVSFALRCLAELYTSDKTYTQDATTLQFRNFLLNPNLLTPHKEKIVRNLSQLPRTDTLTRELVHLLAQHS